MFHLKNTLLATTVCLFATGASAQFLETEILPRIEEQDLTISFDGPTDVDGGKRWENVSLTNADEEQSIRIDWIEEVVDGEGVQITFAPDGSIHDLRSGSAEKIGDIRLRDAVWTVVDDGVVSTHGVNLGSATIDLLAPDGDETVLLNIGETAAVFSLSEGEDLVLTIDGDLSSLDLEISGIDRPEGNVEVAVRDLSGRHETEIPMDLVERADDDTPLTPAEIEQFFGAYSLTDLALGEFSLSVESETSDETPFAFDMTLSDIAGAYALDARDDPTISADLTMGAGNAELDAAPHVSGNGSTKAVTLGFSMGTDRENAYALFQALNAGEDPSSELLGAAQLKYDVKSEGGSLSGEFSDDGLEGEFDIQSGPAFEIIALSDGVFTFETETQDLVARAILSMLGPEELSANADMTRVFFELPVVPNASGTPEDFRFELRLQEYSLSDAVWALFDPGAVVVRDPFNVAIDISALGTLLVPIGEDQMSDETVQLENVTINEFLLSGGGAEITADGTADMDMSRMPPLADGEFTITAKGLIELTSAVAKLGVVPPEALFGVRGALGAFAKAVGEDHFVSEIKVNPDGTITANGLALPLPQ